MTKTIIQDGDSTVAALIKEGMTWEAAWAEASARLEETFERWEAENKVDFESGHPRFPRQWTKRGQTLVCNQAAYDDQASLANVTPVKCPVNWVELDDEIDAWEERTGKTYNPRMDTEWDKRNAILNGEVKTWHIDSDGFVQIKAMHEKYVEPPKDDKPDHLWLRPGFNASDDQIIPKEDWTVWERISVEEYKFKNPVILAEWDRRTRDMAAFWLCVGMSRLLEAGADVQDSKYTDWHSWYWRARVNNRWPPEKERHYDKSVDPKEDVPVPKSKKKERKQIGASRKLTRLARQYYEANKDKSSRNYGEPWLRVLIAFGEEEAVKANLKSKYPLKPFTSTEAWAEKKKWSGWAKFQTELERLENG